MKQLLLSTFTACLFAGSVAFAADDLQALSGKWSVNKVNDQGEKYRQTIEIKKDKFVFEIVGSDDQVRLHAVGDVKLEKLGPFASIRFHHIRAGDSGTEVDDEYVSIYTLDGSTWTVASNFDKDRDQQKPSLDLYQRVKAPAPAKASQ
jgi:uncharacterized protein (TIGR03067 family)